MRRAGLLRRVEPWVGLALFTVTLAVFAQVVAHDFVGIDDRLYITQNPHVQAGLNSENTRWAFRTNHTGNWHPLTWLSHMLDCELFGLRPGLHHLTSAILHALNAVILFRVLKRTKDGLWPAAVVAFLFALHPLHVESVAWASERKDVLSTLFWFLAMWAYVVHAGKPGARRYVPVLVLFGLGLMAKPMLVTLPFVFLLLDLWPLGRLGTERLSRLIFEKVPFLVLSMVSAIVTLLVQRAGGNVSALDSVPLANRLATAIVSYAEYIRRMVWPRGLAFFYPYPQSVDTWALVFSALLLAGATLLALLAIRRRPYIAVGWFWYVGTLVPVIGLVQVGRQANADRYTYVPLVGLFIVSAWGVAEIVKTRRVPKPLVAGVATLLLALVAATTVIQIGTWRNSAVLYTHAIETNGDNYVAFDLLGSELAQNGKIDEAIAAHTEALRIRPGVATAHNNLANALALKGDLPEAAYHYEQALQARPDYAEAHYNLGIALFRLGRKDEAFVHFSAAVRHRPDYRDAHFNLGVMLRARGRGKEAVHHLAEVVRLDPYDAVAHYNLGNALLDEDRIDQAIAAYSRALALQPDHEAARQKLDASRRLRLAP